VRSIFSHLLVFQHRKYLHAVLGDQHLVLDLRGPAAQNKAAALQDTEVSASLTNSTTAPISTTYRKQ
jgi:hypothetical protein